MPQLPTADNYQVHQPHGQSVPHYYPKVVPPTDRTLWMGNVTADMSENYIVASFGAESVGIVRVKITRQNGCAFIEFDSWSAADRALRKYMHQNLPGRAGFYQLNWSSKRVLYPIYVHGLSPSLTSERLKRFFATFYPSVQGVRLEVTGSSIRGQVNFADINDRVRSMREMPGFVFDSSPLVITDTK